MDHLIGVDLGGTKIEAVILKAKGYEVVDRMRVDTEANKGYDTILNNLISLIKNISIKNNLSFDKVGIGTPGTLDPLLNQMKGCNTTALNGRTLKDDLEAGLGMKVSISNDANCFAVAEYGMGIIPEIAPNAKTVFGIIMGTGVGGGLVVNGEVIGGKHGIGGEWGHIYLDSSGGECYCGKIGCVETVISGPATEKYYLKISGHQKKLKEIVNDYREGNNQYANETMDRLLENFGKAISIIINIIDPDAIVIGGGVGNIDELYTEGVQRAKKYVFNYGIETPIVKPKLGDSAGVFGAALL